MNLHTFTYGKYYLDPDNTSDRLLLLGNDLPTLSFVAFEVFDQSPTYTNMCRSTKLDQVSYFFWTVDTDDEVLVQIFSRTALTGGITVCKRFATFIKFWAFGLKDDSLPSFFNQTATLKITHFINYFEEALLVTQLEEADCCLHFPTKIDLSVAV